ncbi:hypothetical protein N7508_006648 [Penicillium antarcticum]|uniref:uncharacterized protein n=1 Tax=Penicillium antarcticum TaxID=416450 RepID=UPI00239FE21A|nr:uncharacterized protein N7508_006648 [Penicillium antarcticum]KAJ5301785.1 hypothetical protein N7508_006648 [Penicillium antarcticum]
MAVKQIIQRIDRGDEVAIIKALIEDGCCVIKNFTDVETVTRVNAEVQPYLDQDKPWKGNLFPEETRRCANLAGRSKTARETWLVDRLIRTLAAKFIDKTTSNFYGATKHTDTSEAVCSIAMTFDIGPGAKAQRLHRDDKNYHVDHEDQGATGYRVGSDVMMAFMVPGVQTTVENGATLAIPGSHLWGSDRAPLMHEAGAAQMDVTDCWVMLGGLYHAGGANMTETEWRKVHGMFFTRGFYRQEENSYLANSAEEVLSWSPAAQKVMGFELPSPNIGFVGFQPPLDYLRGAGVDSFGDFDPSQERELKET